MAEITVLQMPLFKRTYKKLKLNQKQVVDKAIATIGELKRGDLDGVYVYKFDCIHQHFYLQTTLLNASFMTFE